MFQDSQALEILEELYVQHPNAVCLPMYNQKVKLLDQYGLITKASSQAIVDMSDPAFPYILQPIAEDRLKKMHSTIRMHFFVVKLTLACPARVEFCMRCACYAIARRRFF